MIKNYLLLFAAALLVAACGNQETAQHGDASGEMISIGRLDSLHSEILDETRNIWVHVPDEGAGGIYGKSTYPAMYKSNLQKIHLPIAKNPSP